MLRKSLSRGMREEPLSGQTAWSAGGLTRTQLQRALAVYHQARSDSGEVPAFRSARRLRASCRFASRIP